MFANACYWVLHKSMHYWNQLSGCRIIYILCSLPYISFSLCSKHYKGESAKFSFGFLVDSSPSSKHPWTVQTFTGILSFLSTFVLHSKSDYVSSGLRLIKSFSVSSAADTTVRGTNYIWYSHTFTRRTHTGYWAGIYLQLVLEMLNIVCFPSLLLSTYKLERIWADCHIPDWLGVTSSFGRGAAFTHLAKCKQRSLASCLQTPKKTSPLHC